MQYQNGNSITSSVIMNRFKPLHEPISEAQSKDELSLYTDIISSQQMNYSNNKQALKKNKQANGSVIDLIKMNGMHNSIDMSQRMIGSQIYLNNTNSNNNNNNNIRTITNNNLEELNFLNTPKNINANTLQPGEMSMCISNTQDNHSNICNDFNEKISTTYDPSNNLATKPTLSFMNQNIIAPIAYSNNFNSNDQLASESDEECHEVISLEKKSLGKQKKNFSKGNNIEVKANNIEGKDNELIFMNCPHCQKHISLSIQNQSKNKNCTNIFHRIFSACYSCSCTNECQQSTKNVQKCTECKTDINIDSNS